jgi:hypothetical protein
VGKSFPGLHFSLEREGHEDGRRVLREESQLRAFSLFLEIF